MACEDFREEIEAFVLGALEERDARRVEAHVAGCDECSQLVRAYRTAVDSLAFAVPVYHAPSRLRDRILAGAGAVVPLSPRFLLQMRWWASAAAVALLAIAIGGIAWAVMLSSEVRSLREDNHQLAELSQLDAVQRTALLQLRGDLNLARNEQQRMNSTLQEQATLIILALDPDLMPTEMQGTAVAPQARCNYVWSTKQALGALTCKDLPTTSFGSIYQLWVTKGEKTVAVGAFLARTDGTAALLVKFPPETPGSVNNLWVTLETQSASVPARPSNEVVLLPSPVQQAALAPSP